MALCPNIFISHAKEDEKHAKAIYEFLSKRNTNPWISSENLLAGQNWRAGIEKAIKESHFFIAAISETSISKNGFVQKELKVALEVLDDLPESNIFIIPVRLERCQIRHSRLSQLHYIDMFPDWDNGLERIYSN